MSTESKTNLLCHTCCRIGYCVFRRFAENEAQKAINNPSREQGIKTHTQIMEGREIARSQECPQLNDINPSYPQKKYL